MSWWPSHSAPSFMREGSSPDGRDDRPGDAHHAGGVEPDRRMPGTPAIFKDIEGMIFANRDRQKGWIKGRVLSTTAARHQEKG